MYFKMVEGQFIDLKKSSPSDDYDAAGDRRPSCFCLGF